MCADFVAPSPSFAPPPDVLGAYLKGQMARANGQILSQNPLTNEIRQDVAPQTLKEVIGLQGAGVEQLPAGQRLQ